MTIVLNPALPLQVLQHLFLIAKRNHKRQNELIPYNDCLYRNMYRYEYIALLDIDEELVIKELSKSFDTEFPIPSFVRFHFGLLWEFPCPAWAVPKTYPKKL